MPSTNSGTIPQILQNPQSHINIQYLSLQDEGIFVLDEVVQCVEVAVLLLEQLYCCD